LPVTPSALTRAGNYTFQSRESLQSRWLIGTSCNPFSGVPVPGCWVDEVRRTLREQGPVVKYHFVYQKISGETVLELDTDQQPPEPGDSIQLRSSLEPQRLKRYVVDEVLISSQDQPTNTIFIEIEPMRRKKSAG
jgi:hypothetical protein